jgi:hypothetical protein
MKVMVLTAATAAVGVVGNAPTLRSGPREHDTLATSRMATPVR